MRPRLTHIVIDCANPRSLAAFWMQALGYVEKSGGEAWAALIDPEGQGPGLFLQRVPEPKVVKNRVHVDLWHGDTAAEIARLEALGARRAAVQEHRDLTVLADPEGNEFCLYGPAPSSGAP